jgi:hypothetical protein
MSPNQLSLRGCEAPGIGVHSPGDSAFTEARREETMKSTILVALVLALAGWAATPADVQAQVIVRERVVRPAVRRSVVVRPVIPAPVVVTRSAVRAPVLVDDDCRTVTRKVRSGGRVVTTRRSC